ncbi:MAG: transketolase [Ignavibacteria bacterium]|jgi:transketolase
MNTIDVQTLETISRNVREHILRMSTNGGAFTGASLSCADILVYLYKHFLHVSPATLSNDARDILLLSKGHDVPALYGVFAELGYIDKERLGNHLSTSDSIYWHPNRAIPGVEFHSGSLGHLLSVGIGMAIDARLRKLPTRVVVVVGDGELNEGSIWEACLTAAAHQVDNLIVVVDRNGFQANMRTEELIPLEPLAEKFKAFGWFVHDADGHNFEDLHQAFNALNLGKGRPNVLIANTQRGKGVPSIADRADRWFCDFSLNEVLELIDELNGRSTAELTSETLVVR